MTTESKYVTEQTPGCWRVAGTRVSIDSIIHAYWSGLSPEEIARNFPTASLQQIHGVLAWYLENRPEVDRAIAAHEQEWTRQHAAQQKIADPLHERLKAARCGLAQTESP